MGMVGLLVVLRFINDGYVSGRYYLGDMQLYCRPGQSNPVSSIQYRRFSGVDRGSR